MTLTLHISLFLVPEFCVGEGISPDRQFWVVTYHLPGVTTYKISGPLLTRPRGESVFPILFWNGAEDKTQDPVSREEAERIRDGFQQLGFRADLRLVTDPSMAYNLEVTNTTEEMDSFLFSIDMPIASLRPNMVSGELSVELVDTNSDGTAMMLGRFGQDRMLQSVDVFGTQHAEVMRQGTSLMQPGEYSFSLEPTEGPTVADAETMNLTLNFELSAGDTARVSGVAVIDENTGVPFATVPPLPSPGCSSTILIDSPPTPIGDNEALKSCTQLNLLPGGSIGDNFVVGDLRGGSIETEVNIMGGTVGKRLEVFDSVVNVSGGVIGDGTFNFDNRFNAYGESEVNITGGIVDAPVQSSDGALVNISGGTVFSFSAQPDSRVNVSGGIIKFPATAGNGSIVNVSGGRLTVNAEAGSNVNVFGTEFLIDGNPIDALRQNEAFTIDDRDVMLSGKLTDGTPFSWTLCTDRLICGAEYAPDATVTITLVDDLEVPLQPGDSDQDLDVDQFDLIRVQQGAKYRTGEPATWGQGDWNGAPGGNVGNPPAGNGLFDQFDIIAAQQAGVYLTGPYAAVVANGQSGDGQTSIVYDASTGEVRVDAPAGTELTSINIDSAAGIFTSEAAQNLGGSFDNDDDSNIFKATFGGSFGSLSFGDVAQTGLAKDFLLGDLTVVGSLQGGGGLGDVDLVYVPEPSTIGMLGLGLLLGFGRWHPRIQPGWCVSVG